MWLPKKGSTSSKGLATDNFICGKHKHSLRLKKPKIIFQTKQYLKFRFNSYAGQVLDTIEKIWTIQ